MSAPITFYLMIDLSGLGLSATSYSPTVEGPHLEDYEFDPQMYIQPGNPNFEAKLFKNRPNELVGILIWSILVLSFITCIQILALLSLEHCVR